MLNLTNLANLEGAVDENFEALTRAIVSRRYGALGTLRERRQQPGVEFYLRVEHGGELGDPGRVWGWSCKWFMLGRDNELTSGQREQIAESVEKAIQYVEGLTDFVLCLPQRPAKKDEEWIDGLGPNVGISTKLWAETNYEANLAGLDELRSTFFGELVLSPAVLGRAHERSVAPVKARWLPTLHTANDVERELERALLRPASFDGLDEHGDAIASRATALRDALTDIEDDVARARARDIVSDLDRFVTALRAIVDAGRNLRPMEVRERISNMEPPTTSPRRLRALVLELRKRRIPAALAATGLSAEIRDAVRWLMDADAAVRAPLTAVVGAAGLGKTHLAAQLTAPKDGSTAGVFIQGGYLPAAGSLDNLALRTPGLKVEHFQDLLEALNSAGARAGARIPLVIDGLNEAERPSAWRVLLDELSPSLNDYPFVLVIITLREALAKRAIPRTARRLDLEWQRSDVDEIVRTYFDHYLIDAAGAWLPTQIFHNPLLVRMYCEAANYNRQERVGVEALPTSLVGVFELYRDTVIQRLAMDPAHASVPEDQIKRRLAALALEMWTRGVRRLPSDHARAILDPGATTWDESLFRRLEEEGVLFRDEIDGSDETETGILFDRFAGYLIADSLLGRITYADAGDRLAEQDLWDRLLGDGRHTLGSDVAVNLVGLVPRRFNRHHLWRMAPENHRSWALTQELNSESEFLDGSTVDALAGLIVSHDWKATGPSRYRHRHHPFDRLWEVHGSPAHRLNARFLDRVLRLLPIPERDRLWTEWVRHEADDLILDDLRELIAYWSKAVDRVEVDDLDALAISWLLTSTSSAVRDLATKALQRYGRPHPQRLFELAVRMLDTDDPYIVERVVAVAFGAASAHQMPDPGGPFEDALAKWLATLQDRYLDRGSAPTSHELLRSYVRATFELAGALHPGAVPENVDPFALTFETAPTASVMPDDHPNAEECGRTLHMDFENYVIGSTVADRANYDFDHPDFQRARGEVMARVWDLGWRAALLGDIDRAIAEAANRFGPQRARIERYGKKYGWIAYYELVGRLVDIEQLREPWVGGGRNVTPDIDPSFPDEPSPSPGQLPEWAPAGPVDDAAWLRTGAVDIPAALWEPEEVHGVIGGWLLAEGFLEHRRDGHQVFGFFRTLLLQARDLKPALEVMREAAYPGNDLIPPLPTARDVFAGEAPWSRRFEIRIDNPRFRPALRRDWREDGIAIAQVATDLATSEVRSPTALKRSYDVPSFEFADKFGLRQLPGTLDLVGRDGVRASATFRADDPWRGHLLFLRRDLVVDFAGDRRIVQVGWGERQVSVEWQSPPEDIHQAYQNYEHIWRNIRVIGE